MSWTPLMLLALACNGVGTADSGDTNPPDPVDDDNDGYFAPGLDCDDSDPNIHPVAEEVCDGKDNNCDGDVDINATDGSNWYADNDQDGYGDRGDRINACDAPSGYVDDDTDCDDTSDQAFPGGIEVCDGLDNDCDYVPDEPWFDDDLDKLLDAETELSTNGTASQVVGTDHGYLRLTSVAAAQVGTAWIPMQIPGDVFYARFTAEIGGGDGGEGLAFAFVSETDPTSVGANNEGLGVGGLAGYAVELDTVNNGNDSGDDLVAIVQTDWLDDEELQIKELAAGDLGDFQDAGPIKVEVFVDNGAVTVTLDDVEVVSTTVSDYDLADVMVGFTASTGTLTNEHTIDDVYIGCPSRAD